MADEDNDAMIARLMAEEWGVDQEYEAAGDDSDDPDYGSHANTKTKKPGKQGRGQAKKPQNEQAEPVPAPTQPAVQTSAALTEQLLQQQQQWLQLLSQQALVTGLPGMPASSQAPAPAATGAAAAPLAPGGACATQPLSLSMNALPGGLPLPAGVSLPEGGLSLPGGMSLPQAALLGNFPLMAAMQLPGMAGLAGLAGMSLPQMGLGIPGLAHAPDMPPQHSQQGGTPAGAEDEAADGLTATGRRKRKDTGRQRTNSRSWSEEEERLFREALEVHGRDWKKCAEHVGTRDHRAFTSHAQKHFIKLLLRGEEVPPKVAETGRGYTLSGKPLDPNSSSAAAYGLKPDLFEAVCRTGCLQVGVHVTTFDMSEQPAGRRGSSAKKGAAGATSPSQSGPQSKRQRKGKGGTKSSEYQDLEDSDEEEAAAMAAALAATAAVAPGERTEYARNRPRREVGQKARLGETTESLELTHLQEFVGPPGSGTPLAQPFSVVVDCKALLLADFHAHLSSCEIIGLLGGTFDSERRVMEIKEAYPCRRALGSDSGTSVELDAESQVEATAAMEMQGLIPVGWYHSHPIFEPRPSAKDNENQRNYQALCRDAATGLEPWVGLIMSPYDQALETPASRSQLWVVKMHGGGLQPFNVRHVVGGKGEMPGEGVLEKMAEALDQLQEDVGRVVLGELWRGFSSMVGGHLEGKPLTKIEKLRAALEHHLPRDQPAAVAEFLGKVTAKIESGWGVSLPQPNPQGTPPGGYGDHAGDGPVAGHPANAEGEKLAEGAGEQPATAEEGGAGAVQGEGGSTAATSAPAASEAPPAVHFPPGGMTALLAGVVGGIEAQ